MTCDSRHIVCGLLNKQLAVYDRKSLNLVQNLHGHTDHIWSVDMTKDCIVSDQREVSGVKFSTDGALIYVS